MNTRNVILLAILAGLLVLGGCSSGGTSSTPTEGINMAIKTGNTGSESVAGSAASTHSGVSVDGMFFRASEIALYHVDAATLTDDSVAADTAINNAGDAAMDTQVKMDLPDVPNTIVFSRSSESVLPIEQIGNFKNLEYNLININVGHGNFYYSTSEAGHYYEIEGLRVMGVDFVHAANVLLVEQSLWDAVTGSTDAGIAYWENGDWFMADDSSNDYWVRGDDGVQTATNRLIKMVSSSGFDVSGCIVYPLADSIDLTPYTELAAGYNNIDPAEVGIDISLVLDWNMPTAMDYHLLVDPADYDDLNHAVAYNVNESAYDAGNPDLVSNVEQTRPIYNRFIDPGDPTARYNFSVDIDVVSN